MAGRLQVRPDCALQCLVRAAVALLEACEQVEVRVQRNLGMTIQKLRKLRIITANIIGV
jgi:hypothetical protein